MHSLLDVLEQIAQYLPPLPEDIPSDTCLNAIESAAKMISTGKYALTELSAMLYRFGYSNIAVITLLIFERQPEIANKGGVNGENESSFFLDLLTGIHAFQNTPMQGRLVTVFRQFADNPGYGEHTRAMLQGAAQMITLMGHTNGKSLFELVA